MKPYFNRLEILKVRIPMKNFLCVFVIMLSIISCRDTPQINPKIEGLAIDFNIKRYDVALAKASPSDIANLKKEYPYFFTKRYNDAYWEAKMSDTLQKEIEQEVAKKFEVIDDVTHELRLLFKHIKYYFPESKIPKIITVATDVDYRNKLVLTDSLLFVSLSNYLGAEHYFYSGISRFYAKDFRKEQIAVDAAHAFAKAQIVHPQSSQFIAQLIYEGKKLYLMEQLLNPKPLHEVLSYTDEELAFARENEVNIWEFFVRKELLFSTDRKLLSRFVAPAPFSKFYLDFDNETPGRIGRYIGYQIVTSFMANTKYSIKNMLLQDAETLYTNSKYKP